MYQRHLVKIMTPHLLRFYENLWTATKRNRRQFQLALREVPAWNQSKIEEQTNEILLKTPFLDDVIAAVFLSVVKVLSYVRLPGSRTDIRVQVPAKTVFVHAAYVAAAAELFDSVNAGQRVFEPSQRRLQQQIASSAVERAVQELLPLKQLLDAYISNEIAADGTVSPEPYPGASRAPPPESIIPSFSQPHPDPCVEPGEGDGEGEGEAEGEAEGGAEPEPVAEDENKAQSANNWLDEGQADEGQDEEHRRIELSPRAQPAVMSGEAGGGGELDD